MLEFDPKEFFDLALKVSAANANEAGFRTAINRVYYSCHLVGRSATAKKGWFEPKFSSDDHSGLWRAIHEHGPRAVADKLRALSELREHADYRVDDRVTSETWQTAKEIAADILPKLASINPRREGQASR